MDNYSNEKLEHCPFCGAKCGPEPKYRNLCGNCAESFKKLCVTCKVKGFWEYCFKCGGTMINATHSVSKSVPQVRSTDPSETLINTKKVC